MKKILIGILVLLMIGLIYIILTKQKLKEGFDPVETPAPTTTVTPTPILLQQCNDYSIIGMGSNPLIDRNNTNVIINPTDTANICIGSPGNGVWDTSTNLSKAFIVVNLNSLMKITSIVTQGLKYFRVYFSQTDNIDQSYEEILYQDSSLIKGDNTIYFTANSYENPTQFNNLLTQDGQSVFAQFIKIVPMYKDNIIQDPLITPTPDSNPIGSKGVKLEIFGMMGDSKITNGGASLIGSAKFYDINGKVIRRQSISKYGNQVNVSEFTKGIYFINIISSLGETTFKFVKK